MSNNRNTLGGRIQTVRQNLKISQETLAEAISIDPSGMSRIETDSRLPDALLLKNICEQLNISADYILWGKETPLIQPLTISAEEKAAIRSLYNKINSLPD